MVPLAPAWGQQTADQPPEVFPGDRPRRRRTGLVDTTKASAGSQPGDSPSLSASAARPVPDAPAGLPEEGAGPAQPRLERPRAAGWHGKVHTFDSFRYFNYRFLWGATFFSSGGYWLQQVIIGWMAYDITRSPLLTSLALGLDALPILLVGPVGGVLVDGLDRRKLLVAIFAYQGALTLAFAAAVFLEQDRTWHLFAFTFLMGLSWVITDPARMSLIPNIVPRHSLVNAFALNSLAFSTTRLAVPALGGALLELIGPAPALLLEAALQLTACGLALTLRIEGLIRRSFHLASTFSELLKSLVYVRGEPLLVGLLVLAVLPSVLIMPFVHGLMPVYAAEVFHTGPAGLGILLSAIGAGATLGTFLLASLGDIRYKGRLLFISSALGMAMAALFSHDRVFGLAFLNLMALSSGVMMFFAATNAAIHGIVRDEFRGRVSGLYMVTWGLSPVGSLMAGLLAQRLGAPWATLIASGVMAVALGALALRFKALWKSQ